MIIEIISIGDEILAGNIVDTNKQYLSDVCWQHGFRVEYHTGVRDDEKAIREALLRAAERADAVLCTGGLGPTADDFTIEVAAGTFGVPLVEDPETLKHLKDLYNKKKRELTDNDRKQALIPQGGRALANRIGTAPGVYFPFKDTHFYFMPGVPAEMKYIFGRSVLGDLVKNRKEAMHFATRLLKTFGCAESDLDNKLKDLFHDRTAIANARIGYRFHFPEVFIKVSVWDKDKGKAQKDLQTVVDKLYERIGKFIYSENEAVTLEALLVQKLMEAGKTVAVAESCTGGLVANRITNVSGSSHVFLGGFVAYSDRLKEEILGVSRDTLKKEGAVSAACAEEIVRGVSRITHADFCASVTGIAGPTGGSPEKPVGTVYIATLCDGDLFNKKYHLPFPREMFKQIVSSVVLKKFLDRIK